MATKQEKILIVDDEDVARALLCQKLSREGYQCHEAGNAKQALEKLESNPIELVLLDIKMPDRSGAELLPEIKAGYPDTAVIMATALTDNRIAIQCMKQGAYDYLTKPFNLSEVVLSVQRALERRRLELKNKDYQQHLEELVEERKQAEQQLQKAHDELEIRVEERTRELVAKTNELEQLLYVASHDMRSPLVNIQGFTKELGHTLEQVRSVVNSDEISSKVKEELATILDKDAADAFEHIIKSSSKMDSLLSGLLQLSRLSRTELIIKPLDMNKVVHDVVSACDFHIQQAGARLQVELLPPCLGDETQINQVFSHLFGNALKFLDPNRPGIIMISGRKENGQAVYCVEDNGIGIAGEHQKKIFDLLSHLNPSSADGKGLGLTVVQRILSRHSGKIWVESELGKGSKFYMTLPAVESMQERNLKQAKTKAKA